LVSTTSVLYLKEYFNECGDEIPGVDKILAMGILAEATNQMSKFEDERKFAAWAGVAAGNNESAGKKKDQKLEKAIRTCVES
jgi:transposase